MFKCQHCQNSSRSYHRLVVEQRKVTYTTIVTDPKKGQKTTYGNGWEIVRELTLCFDCFQANKDKSVKMSAEPPPECYSQMTGKIH